MTDPGLEAAFAQALHNWRRVEALERQRIVANANRTAREKPERRDPKLSRKLWTMARAFLLAHGKDGLHLPPEIALWLHVQVDTMLAGHPPLDFQRKARGTSRTPIAIMCQRVAVEFVELAKMGRIKLSEEEARAKVREVFPIGPTKVDEWRREHGPHGSLSLILDKLPPGTDATAVCIDQLAYNAAFWRDEVMPSEKRD